jgi:hypothetical protein
VSTVRGQGQYALPPALTLIVDDEANFPNIDLSETNETAFTLLYGTDVKATFPPTNELS